MPLRVLVVDDDPDTVETLAVILRLWGHGVRTAGNGVAALAAVDSSPPDVVLFDIAMPGMDGLELAGKLRRGAGKPPLLIAVSGFADYQSRRRALDAGAHLHLAKPVDLLLLKTFLERFEGVISSGRAV